MSSHGRGLERGRETTEGKEMVDSVRARKPNFWFEGFERSGREMRLPGGILPVKEGKRRQKCQLGHSECSMPRERCRQQSLTFLVLFLSPGGRPQQTAGFRENEAAAELLSKVNEVYRVHFLYTPLQGIAELSTGSGPSFVPCGRSRPTVQSNNGRIKMQSPRNDVGADTLNTFLFPGYDVRIEVL